MGSDSAGASKKSFSDGPEILPFQPEFFILDGQKLSLKHMGFQDLVELFSLINQSCLRSNARGCLLLSWIWAKAAWKDPKTPQQTCQKPQSAISKDGLQVFKKHIKQFYALKLNIFLLYYIQKMINFFIYFIVYFYFTCQGYKLIPDFL